LVALNSRKLSYFAQTAQLDPTLVSQGNLLVCFAVLEHSRTKLAKLAALIVIEVHTRTRPEQSFARTALSVKLVNKLELKTACLAKLVPFRAK
jgi:hypothetical protein